MYLEEYVWPAIVEKNSVLKTAVIIYCKIYLNLSGCTKITLMIRTKPSPKLHTHKKHSCSVRGNLQTAFGTF